jgi:hypothetical protein
MELAAENAERGAAFVRDSGSPDYERVLSDKGDRLYAGVQSLLSMIRYRL